MQRGDIDFLQRFFILYKVLCTLTLDNTGTLSKGKYRGQKPSKLVVMC
jgi:hypothetical protein